MKRRSVLVKTLAVALAAGGGVAAFRFLRRDDEGDIRELLQRLAEDVSIPDEREYPAFYLDLKARLGERLTRDATVTVPELDGPVGVEAIVGAVVEQASEPYSVDVRLSDVKVLRIARPTASAEAVVEIVHYRDMAPKRMFRRRVAFALVHQDDAWRVSAIEAGPEL